MAITPGRGSADASESAGTGVLASRVGDAACVHRAELRDLHRDGDRAGRADQGRHGDRDADGAGLARAWPHDRAHSFFSRASWSVEILGIALAHLIVRTLPPHGAAVTVSVDDTLFKRRGKKVFGAAWQHDGAAAGAKPVGRASG
ncbi:transposase [Streptomyces sp. NPDC057611]|uniref:transposase n=1 Tax=Streptomyces sp. NPDC057611 TaxID=3346182 RepID=UPI0036BF7700